MSFGLEILASDNAAIISSETSNLVFIGKAAYASAWCAHSLSDLNASRKNYWQLTYTIATINRPFVYVECPAGTYVGVEGVTPNGEGSWSITIGVGSYQNSLHFVPAVYCFSKLPDSRIPLGYGIAVYSETGALRFDSTAPYKYLQTDSIFSVATPGWPNGTVPTNTATSSIPNVVPIKVASSYSVNAKGTTSGYYGGLYNLALGTHDGDSTFSTQWFALAASSSRAAWGVFDTASRVTSLINAGLFD